MDVQQPGPPQGGSENKKSAAIGVPQINQSITTRNSSNQSGSALRGASQLLEASVQTAKPKAPTRELEEGQQTCAS